MSKVRERWYCFHCGKLYDRPETTAEAYDERGNATGVYYCLECRDPKKRAKDLKDAWNHLVGTPTTPVPTS